MILAGKAVVVPGDNVDTDVLYPGSFLNIEDPELMKAHLFEGLDPALREELDGDTVLVVGENFGCGSSREHVPHAMRASGVRCVVGRSFARIFHRNCINLGLPIVVCPGAAAAARPGGRIAVDGDTGTIDVEGQRFEASALPPFMQEMIRAGGLVPWARERLA